MDRFRVGANLATTANGVLGVGAILYTVAGNPLWAMLLVASGIAFDGLDGLLSRRSPRGPGAFGRVADSLADAVTFGLAPAFLVADHTDHAAIWASSLPAALAVGILVAVLAIARLIYFTVRGFQLPYFLGAPTPQTALGIISAALFLEIPGFLGVYPVAFLGVVALLAIVMVVPVPFPKIRRGSALRPVATVTALAIAVSLLILQFRPAAGAPLYWLAEIAALVATLGTAAYYLAGPWTVPRPAGSPA